MDLECIVLNKVTQIQKEEKNGRSPSYVAYNVNTSKCGATFPFRMKTKKG